MSFVAVYEGGQILKVGKPEDLWPNWEFPQDGPDDLWLAERSARRIVIGEPPAPEPVITESVVEPPMPEPTVKAPALVSKSIEALTSADIA